MLVGFEEYFRMIDRELNFVMHDRHNKELKFRYMPATRQYLFTNTSGDCFTVHKDSLKTFIVKLFLDESYKKINI
jgi:hypothetical protein